MNKVEKSVLIEYSAGQMYALVDDIERYPQFLPWCGGSEVTLREANKVQATLHINYHGIKQSFSTENRTRPGESIEVSLVKGPFRQLNGHWRFIPLAEEACKVEFKLSYEFSSRILETIIGPVFSVIANSFIEAFVKRARQLYRS
ncbi:MAG: type II toxin-antitoxin system RatA family toxin [Burkholderiales bacterium]